MRILNAIFGRKKGVIEQSFIDYSRSLLDLDCEVVAISYQDSQIVDSLPTGIEIKTITNFGQWDPIAMWKLKKIVREINPDVIIAHGNRASSLLNKAIKDIPVVTLFHSYNPKQIDDCPYLLTVTEDLKNNIVKKNIDRNKIYVVPNMIYLSPNAMQQEPTMHEPPVIGAMGRLVAKKGFNIYIKALSILKNRGVKFKAKLAGEGLEEEKLKNLAASLSVDDVIEFTGWIENKQDFFSSIDVFCLPSIQESFGRVILEAFMNSVPVITTDTEGPIEIIKPFINGMIVESGEADTLANAIEKMINNPKIIERMVKEGFNTVKNTYDNKIVGKKLYDILQRIVEIHKQESPIPVASAMIE